MNQCRNATTDDIADLEESPYDKELPCSCGQCSSAESTNEEIEAMGRRTKSIRDSNSELENRVKDLQNQVRNLERLYYN